MSSQQPNQDQQQYQTQHNQGHHPTYQTESGQHQGPGVNAPLLQFQEATGRYEAPPNPQTHYETPPNPPPRRTDTSAALPQGQDRSHQVEVMQSYEMSRPQTDDEQNQAILQREFPGIDSSLIAAIYGDSGSLSATREMLQELATEG